MITLLSISEIYFDKDFKEKLSNLKSYNCCTCDSFKLWSLNDPSTSHNQVSSSW